MNVVLNTAQVALNILPEQSAEKLRLLIERRLDAHAVLKRRDAELQAAIEARDAKDRDRRRRLEGNATAGPGARMTAEERAALDAPIIAAEQEIDRRRKAYDAAVAAWRAFDIVSECEAWVSDAARSGVRLKYVAPIPPKTTASAAVEVEKLRRRLDEIQAEFAAVESAPRPASAMREALKAELDRLAAEPRVRLTERENSPVDIEAAVKGVRDDAGRVHSDPFGFLLWAIRPAIEERLLAILPTADVPGAMSDADRDAAMDRLIAERLSVEREEEAIIAAAEAAGLQIARRREASPLAILEVAIVAGRLRD